MQLMRFPRPCARFSSRRLWRRPFPAPALCRRPGPIEDDAPYGLLLIDRLEYSANEGSNTLNWEALGWFGGDVNRLWLNTEGKQRLQGAGREIRAGRRPAALVLIASWVHSEARVHPA